MTGLRTDTMRRAAKKDANHVEIVAALRKAGATVVDLGAVGHGVPDLLIGHRGRTMLMEIKDGNKCPSHRHLPPDQEKFFAAWQGGTLAVVDSVDAALRMLGLLNH